MSFLLRLSLNASKISKNIIIPRKHISVSSICFNNDEKFDLNKETTSSTPVASINFYILCVLKYLL